MSNKRKLTAFLCIIAAMALMMCFTACGSRESEEEPEQAVEKAEEKIEDMPEIVTTIEGVDDNAGSALLPLQIQSVTLFEDGTVAVIPTDDLLKIAEDNDEVKDGAIYPFADSGKVKQIYLVEYGNGGYRTIIALMDDGTLSAINGKALIDDHIAVVMDGVAGRDNFTDVEERSDESAHYLYGITDDGQEVELDYSLNF